LRQPTPPADYERINIGDVGYVYQGSFHRLFNPTLPKGDPRNAKEPPNYVQLDLERDGGVTNILPHFPGDRECEWSFSCVFILEKISRLSIGVGGGFKFQATETSLSGAILITREDTEGETAIPIRRMEEYAINHAASWFEFACDKGRPVRSLQDLIFITEYVVTSGYAMAAFSQTNAAIELKFDATVPVVSASASVWGSWKNESTFFVHQNCGPHIKQPRLRSFQEGVQLTAQQQEQSSVSQGTPRSIEVPKKNQCVMLKGIRVEKRLLFPKKIRAAAGPHDLGPGHRED
ncbi:hypothetical protein BU17DRAFT_31878, partial [Hysterangium stoloniferum]